MASLKALKRPSKWRSKVRVELDQNVRQGIKLYGVRKDGQYVAKSRAGDKILKRDVRGSVVAKSAHKA